MRKEPVLTKRKYLVLLIFFSILMATLLLRWVIRPSPHGEILFSCCALFSIVVNLIWISFRLRRISEEPKAPSSAEEDKSDPEAHPCFSGRSAASLMQNPPAGRKTLPKGLQLGVLRDKINVGSNFRILNFIIWRHSKCLTS